MRRSDIQKAVSNLYRVIEESEVRKLFEDLSSHRTSPDAATILKVYQKFSIEYNILPQTERQILEIFELDSLAEPDFWSGIIQPNSDEGYYSTSVYIDEKLTLLHKFLPKVLKLFRQDYVNILSEEEASRPIDFQNKDILTIILPEEGDHFSKPLRLSEIINGIIQLYQACAFLTDQSPDDLVVLAIDSGSDKSFDFLGAAEAIKCLKETIFEIWDRIVFNKYKVAGERVQLATVQLSALEKINFSEQEGKIGREQAEILRRNVIGGAEKFVETGAITPELDSRSYNNPRQLMSPEPKMLVEKTPSSQKLDDEIPAPTNLTPPPSGGGFTPEQMAQIAELMNRFRGNGTEGSEDSVEDQ